MILYSILFVVVQLNCKVCDPSSKINAFSCLRQYRMSCSSASIYTQNEALTLYLACAQASTTHTHVVLRIIIKWRGRVKASKPEHQVELYQMLRLLEGELDAKVFQQLMSQFMEYWVAKEAD